MNRQGKILLCYVLPNYLGSGIGHRLLKALEGSASEWRLTKIHADSTITAQGFYACQGFINVGQAFELEDIVTEYPMAKTLPN